MDLTVRREHRVDASEQRADGGYDWYSAYSLYEFEQMDRKLSARQFDDEPTKAAFLSQESRRKRPSGWQASRNFEEVPYDDPLFVEAARHLIREGVEELSVLSSCGYIKVDRARID